MAVMARESWTDERLDDLKEGMNGGFDRVGAEMKEGFARVDKKFEQVEKRLERTDTDIRELRQALGQIHTTMSVGFIGLAGLIVSGQIFF